MRRGGIFAILYMLFGGIIEKCEPSIPAENWANKELMHQDLMNGVSAEQRLRYAKQGRYYIPKSVTEAYPNPHRDEKGKIIDVIAGTAFICDCSEDELQSLSTILIDKYLDKFEEPERFAMINGKIVVIK